MVIYKKSLEKNFALCFANDYLEKTVSKASCTKTNLIYLISPIKFAHTDCPSHCSFIPIQRSKNQNLKIKIAWITNSLLYIFIYKKKDERQREKEEKTRKK
jgi:hypothetical protein